MQRTDAQIVTRNAKAKFAEPKQIFIAFYGGQNLQVSVQNL
jgi:hypothetical protein